MDGTAVNWEILLGHVELKQEYRWNGSDLECYGWSIDYDRHGNIHSRTEPSLISTMHCAGVDYETQCLMSSRVGAGAPTYVPPPTIVDKLKRWIFG